MNRRNAFKLMLAGGVAPLFVPYCNLMKVKSIVNLPASMMSVDEFIGPLTLSSSSPSDVPEEGIIDINGVEHNYYFVGGKLYLRSYYEKYFPKEFIRL